MEDKGKKPLRTTSNKLKDIMNTYIKQEEKRQIKSEDLFKSIEDDMGDFETKTDEPLTETTTTQGAELEDEKNQLIIELTAERDEFKDKFLRTAAEFENLRRRTIKEKQEIIEYANERLLFKLLELLDDLNNAVTATKSSSDIESILQGIEMINQKARKLFNDAGITQIEDPIGKPFNVDYHEALMHIPSELPENYVLQVIQPGYMLNDKVLRHAKVVTSAGNSQTK